YRLNRGSDTSNVVAVKIAVGTPPVGVTDTYSTGQNTGQLAKPLVTQASNGVLANDLNRGTSPNARTFAVLLSQPSFGKLIFTPDGGFTYLPTVGFTGTDSFTYAPSTGMLGTGGELLGNPTSVIITVR